MCGIAGFVDYAGASPHIATLQEMMRSLSRRGPDANGTLIEGACGLAHTRLSIIDLAGSPQPMQLPGAVVSLVYNGELYNYRELRRQLSADGTGLVTNGDTEAILRWVEREWDQCLHRFNGMFAFGAWHSRDQKILLARDPIGEKPLFYACPRPDLLVFGSEIKAVLEHPEVSRELNINSLRQVLRFRAVYGEDSLYQGIKQLRPGCFLEFSRAGIRSGRFYDLAERVESARMEIRDLGYDAIYARCETLLRDSIRERLIADVPVGAFLSGGLDSSLIVALIRQLRPPEQKVRTYSVGFSGDHFSELPFARKVAETIGTDHTEVHVAEDKYLARLAELTACRDAPISEPADIAIAEMSAIARRDVKVVLSGEGADEVFGGYPKYTMAAVPRIFRAAAKIVGPTRIAGMAGCIGLDKRRALVAARALAQPNELSRIVQWFSYLDRTELQQLLPGLDWTSTNWSETVIPQEEAMQQFRGGDSLGRMQTVDCMTWLPGNMLERGDRMTMAEGLELRPPFLDRELVPFGIALRSRFKVRGRTTKWLLRRLAGNLLPRSIANRPKWGFRVPLAVWFRGCLRPILYDYLLARNGLCATYGSRPRIAGLLEAHDTGRIDANLSLWTLLTAEIWFQDVYQARIADARSIAVARTDLLEQRIHFVEAWSKVKTPISIIIPAHNEVNVIARTLQALLDGAGSGEIDIVVVCNGCEDRTANLARAADDRVRVIETPLASKSAALNLGDVECRDFPRFYIDADVVLPLPELRKLAARLITDDVLAVAPRFRMDLTGCSWAVRAFYNINDRLPSAQEGIGGSGVYGLSQAGRKRFDEFPKLTADDAFVRLSFSPSERATLDGCFSTVFAPKTLKDLIAIKTRSHYGTAELRQKMPELWKNRGTSNGGALMRLIPKFWLWPKLAAYGYVKIFARLRARRRLAVKHSAWERDETSRMIPQHVEEHVHG